MQLVEAVLTEETERCNVCFHKSTHPKLLAVVQKALLTDRMPVLLSMPTGISFLFKTEQHEDLKRVFHLFGYLENGRDPLASVCRRYVTDRGHQLIGRHSTRLNNEIAEMQAKEAKNIKTFVQKQLTYLSIVDDLLAFYQTTRDFVTDCFAYDVLFRKAIREAFEECMNKPIGPHTTAAFLSSYCDQLMRHRCPSVSDSSVDYRLTQIVELFGFLNDKDLFIDIYRIQFARRLLTNASYSLDTERLMISKLKLACGAHFTSRLEGMLTDLTLSSDTQKEFRDTVLLPQMRTAQAGDEPHEADRCPILTQPNGFSVTVLTTGHWPTYQTPHVLLPREMQHCLDVFTEFYTQKKTSHRKLTWIHHLGTVTLTGRFAENRVYDIQCNTFQACLLLLFNDNSTLTPSSITEALQVDPLLTKKNIASFLVVRLLMKKSADQDEYILNEHYAAKSRVIKVPIPVQEEAHNRDKVDEDRSVAVEAAVVRIMKSRKTLSHTELVMEVLNQLSLFKPTPRVIKNKIESLIEREFLERSPTNPQEYIYTA